MVLYVYRDDEDDRPEEHRRDQHVQEHDVYDVNEFPGYSMNSYKSRKIEQTLFALEDLIVDCVGSIFSLRRGMIDGSLGNSVMVKSC